MPAQSSRPGAAADVERFQAILERVSRADLFVKSFAGIQVVVHSIHTRRLQLQSLLRLQQTQAAANMQTVSVLDLTNHIGHMIDFTIARATSAGHDAIGASFAFAALRAPSSSRSAFSKAYFSIGASEILDCEQ
jgi:hypothetical protein